MTTKYISGIVLLLLLFSPGMINLYGAYAADNPPVVRDAPVNSEADDTAFSGAGDDSAASSISLYDWFVRGGAFMWPILVLAAVGMGFVIERFLYYRKMKLNPREFIEELEAMIGGGTVEEVERLCRERNLVIARVLGKGLKLRKLGLDHVEKAIGAGGAIEVAALEKGLNILSAIGNIAPLLGFLGTVSGMISAFQSIAAADQVSARLVAGGIYEALVTTEAGLIVAIPLLAFYNYFVHRVESFVAEIERLASDIVEKLVRENGADKA
ncbi:MAG: MotA/TolQ/ExbB proton channel family protein [Spirochaetota bacterium]